MKKALWTPTKPPFGKFKKKVFRKVAKVSDFIYQIGDYDALREASSSVSLEKISSSEYKKKFSYLKRCLRNYKKITGYGRGISAIQVGIPEKFFVIFINEEETLLVINPKVTKQAEKYYLYSEMCMSAGAIIAPTTRPAWIEFEYYNEHGEKCYWDKKDDTTQTKMLNRVFEHEIDHMEGIINIDRVKSNLLFLESDPNYYKNTKLIEINKPERVIKKEIVSNQENHDIKSLLMSLKASIDLLERKLQKNDDDGSFKYVTQIKKYIDSLTILLIKILK